MRLGAILTCILLALPAVNAAADPGVAAKPLKLSVAVDVLTKGSTQRRPLTPGEALSAGDRLGLRAEVDQGAFAVVLHEDSNGNLAVVVPSASAHDGLPLAAGVQTYLPQDNGLLELDAHKGRESLYVVTSSSPLNVEEAKLHARSLQPAAAPQRAGLAPEPVTDRPHGVRLRGSPSVQPPPPPPPPPHPVGSTERRPPCDGRVHVSALPGRGAQVRNVAVALFCFEHTEEDRAPHLSPLRR